MNFLILLFFSIAGFTLKIGDDLIDIYHKGNLANIPLVISAIMLGLLTIISNETAVIVISIILGVLISKKVDSYQYVMGITIIVLLPLIIGIQYNIDIIKILYLVGLLTIMGVIDEKGDSISEAQKRWYILRYRPFMKIIIIILAIFSVISIDTALGFLLFDLMYIIATKLSSKRVYEE